MLLNDWQQAGMIYAAILGAAEGLLKDARLAVSEQGDAGDVAILRQGCLCNDQGEFDGQAFPAALLWPCLISSAMLLH